MSPLEAVRKKCLWCCNNQSKEIELCPVVDCELYPYRFGKNPSMARRLTLKIIRNKCVDCSGHHLKEVKNCLDKDCNLFQYRNGNNPALVGKRVQSYNFSKNLHHRCTISDETNIDQGIFHGQV